jgi:uncharacterized protein YndB with AHSA1/START domain
MNTTMDTSRGFTIVRLLDAPRQLVFKAWTDPDHLRWFAGPGLATESHPTTVDLRVGGAWRFHMVENEERSYTTGGIYQEIVPPEKLVFTWGAVDGWPLIDPARLDEAPRVTVTFNDLDGKTEMILHVGFSDHLTEERVREWLSTGMVGGWNETLDRLAPYLSNHLVQ